MNVPTLEHNANGSNYCTRCQCIVILFDDDEHDADDCDYAYAAQVKRGRIA